MRAGDLIKHLEEMDADTLVTFISWDPALKKFVKWGLAGVSERGEILTGETIDFREWPESFA